MAPGQLTKGVVNPCKWVLLCELSLGNVFVSLLSLTLCLGDGMRQIGWRYPSAAQVAVTASAWCWLSRVLKLWGKVMQQRCLAPPHGHLGPGIQPAPGSWVLGREEVGGGGALAWCHTPPQTPHNREKMSAGCPEPEPPHSLPCCGPGTAPGLGAGVPLLTEDMQALTLRTLAASDVTKHYELVRELGKGTYGKVDLVAYKGTGE